jgi:alkaline phosphatase
MFLAPTPRLRAKTFDTVLVFLLNFTPSFFLITFMNPTMTPTQPRYRAQRSITPLLTVAFLASGFISSAWAAPTVTRLTPPSELFTSGQAAPLIARFLPGQRFDLQATIAADDASKSITTVQFMVDQKPVKLQVSLKDCSSGCLPKIAKNSTIASARAYSIMTPGVHTLSVKAEQSDGQSVLAQGNFEIIPLSVGGHKVKNIIIMLGDGMGAAQRTAARIVGGGYAQGKVITPLAMDTFPVTGMVKTSSLNSIVTDSAPGMSSYVSGNKNNNNEEGVFPDDTLDAFDNPRIEYLSEYLHRTQGKALGVVTTADVFDATPAANAVHTSNRGAGTGIVDQFLDDRDLSGLTVLMGGGRKWFLPSSTPGSARSDKSDYAFSSTDAHTALIAKAWGAKSGKLDTGRDLIADFQSAGFTYAPTRSALQSMDAAHTERLLGLFAFSNMNVALDKIDGRRGQASSLGTRVVDDFGLPDQPMLDEMTDKALAVLSSKKNGFVLMVEGASIDKQAHNMDTERWILDTMEFDKAIARAQDYAKKHKDTLVIVTADHECAGTALIGASMVSDAQLIELGKAGGAANLRDNVVGIYAEAGFPKYTLASDGYPQATNIDRRLLVGYGANPDRNEDWRTNDRPIQDSQQPFIKQAPLNAYPANATDRDVDGKFLITGQVPGSDAVHTATDIPLSAFGLGAWSFTGVMDNTDVFFKIAQSAVGGVVLPTGFK